MANMNVTYSRMEDSARRLKSGKADLDQKLTELRNLITQLVNDGFTTTSASGAFDQSYQEFTQGAKKTISGLDGMADFLTKAAQTMRQVDQDLARSLRGQ